MTVKKDINIKNYCDVLDKELSGMKSRLLEITDHIECFTASEKELLKPHVGHLHDLASTIDWKLDILLKACPFDWHRHDKEFESTASVRVKSPKKESEFSGGYVGG